MVLNISIAIASMAVWDKVDEQLLPHIDDVILLGFFQVLRHQGHKERLQVEMYTHVATIKKQGVAHGECVIVVVTQRRHTSQ